MQAPPILSPRRKRSFITVSNSTSRVTRRKPGRRLLLILSSAIPLPVWTLSIQIQVGSSLLTPIIIVPFTRLPMEAPNGLPLYPDPFTDSFLDRMSSCDRTPAHQSNAGRLRFRSPGDPDPCNANGGTG